MWRVVPGLRPSLESSLADGALPVVAREFELTYPEPRTVRLYMVPFKSDDAVGKGQRYAVILTDVSHDKATTEERIENERLQSCYSRRVWRMSWAIRLIPSIFICS